MKYLIPIQHEDYKFADPTTRVLVIQGTPRPCLVHYPLKVAGLGNWFTLGPHIKTVSQSDIPKPHYTAPVITSHDWDQDVGGECESCSGSESLFNPGRPVKPNPY